jgi:hypothetical protein
LELPRADPSYWLNASAPTVIYECHSEEVCLGGIDACGSGYEGLACGRCKAGFYRDEHRCLECEEDSEAQFYILMTVCAFVAVLGSLCVAMFVKDIPYALYGTFGIAIFFFQVVGMMRQIQLEWPVSIAWTLNVFSFFNINLSIFKAECTVGKFDHFQRSLVVLLLPVSVLTLASVAKFVHVQCARRPFEDFLKTVGNVAVLMTTVGFAFVAQQTITLIDCQWQPAAKLYTLRAEPTQYCFDASWLRTYLPLGLASLVVYLGIILMINHVVATNQDSLRNMNGVVFKALQGIYYKYGRGEPLWEAVVILYKLIIVCIITLMSRWPSRTCFMLVLVIAFAFAHHQFKKPFASEENNQLMQITLGSLFLVLMSSSVLYTPIPEKNKDHVMGEMTKVVREVFGILNCILLFGCAGIIFVFCNYQTKTFRYEREQKRLVHRTQLKDAFRLYSPTVIEGLESRCSDVVNGLIDDDAKPGLNEAADNNICTTYLCVSCWSTPSQSRVL